MAENSTNKVIKTRASLLSLGVNISALLFALVIVLFVVHRRSQQEEQNAKRGNHFRETVILDANAHQAMWPLPHAVQDAPHKGVTHWLDNSPDDGTVVDFFDFDLEKNPGLRLEIYDQDEDDAKPFDNVATYWNHGVGWATAHLNASDRGPVVAAWNGLFFDLNGQGADRVANHLTPVVLNGKLHYGDLPTYRWTFGIHYEDGHPQFSVLHMPKPADVAKRFDFAAGAAQCVIKEGQPLKLEPYPKKAGYIPPSHDSTPDEAGYIRIVDHMKVSRTSIGWTKDYSHLYLLFVSAPSSETESALAFKHGTAVSGGWSLADIQRFWMAKGVWCAINSDGGGPAQLTYRLPNGNYYLLPPAWAADNTRRLVGPDFKNAPPGGSLMYFYVRDATK